jgi:hypothetical protein
MNRKRPKVTNNFEQERTQIKVGLGSPRIREFKGLKLYIWTVGC